MRATQTQILLVLAATLSLPPRSSATLQAPYETEWIRQLGTSLWDSSHAVSCDSLGNVYISGLTYGSLGGHNAGSSDAFVSKYDSAGKLLWARQLGTPLSDESWSVSADALGNVYISGWTQGWLNPRDPPHSGSLDAFVAKYDPAGNLLWTRQYGTENDEVSRGVSADVLGNVYISGYMEGNPGLPGGPREAFINKYNSSGIHLWTRQIVGLGWVWSQGVSADSLGNVYISGHTSAPLDPTSKGWSDAFVSKFDSAGALLWTRQLGTTGPSETSFGVSADRLGNVFMSGSIDSGGSSTIDAFVTKYNSEGHLLWTRQLGSGEVDSSLGLSADGAGNVFIAGYTRGSLGGPNAGEQDAFVSKYDTDGNLLWTLQIGTSELEYAYGVTVDTMGNAYLTGYTEGSLGGPNAGSADAFLVKLIVPEPGTIFLLGFGGLALLRRGKP